MLLNKFQRKAFLTSVQVNSANGDAIGADWWDSISSGGNPIAPGQLVGVIDSTRIFIRKRDRRSLDFAPIEVHHSIPDSSMILQFQVHRDFGPVGSN